MPVAGGFTSLLLSGILAVGYTNGQIHVLKIEPNDPSQEPTVMSIYSESDFMRISCLTVVSLPEVSRVPLYLSLCWIKQNQQNDLCTNQRLRSAWASTQSIQPFLCSLWVAKAPNLFQADSKH